MPRGRNFFGRGFWWRGVYPPYPWFYGGYPTVSPYYSPWTPIPKEQEIQMLESQIQLLEQELESLRNRLATLSGEQ